MEKAKEATVFKLRSVVSAGNKSVKSTMLASKFHLCISAFNLKLDLNELSSVVEDDRSHRRFVSLEAFSEEVINQPVMIY